MKKITLLFSLLLLLTSCGIQEKKVAEDNRITTCETIGVETQEKLLQANTNPDIELTFLGIETILADVSSCFLKVQVSNPNDDSQADVYSLFDVVREKTRESFNSLEELEAAIENVRAGSKVSIKIK